MGVYGHFSIGIRLIFLSSGIITSNKMFLHGRVISNVYVDSRRCNLEGLSFFQAEPKSHWKIRPSLTLFALLMTLPDNLLLHEFTKSAARQDWAHISRTLLLALRF